MKFMNILKPQQLILKEIPSDLGLCFGLIDEHYYMYIALATKQYSSIVLRELVSELKIGFYKDNPIASQHPIKNSSINSKFIEELSTKYNNMQRNSKSQTEDNEVAEIRIDITTTVRQIANNHEEIKVN